MDPAKRGEPALSVTPLGVEEIVILKLKGVSFKVNKTKLSNESDYFNKLFAGGYRDSSKKEYEINYKVNLETFKTFVDWLDDEDLIDDIWGHYYNRIISKYVHRCYKELLELFRFASFYIVDNLLESLTYIIVLKWLQRDNLIELWLLAEELGQDNLRSVVFSTCLDLFEQLPVDAVLNLPRKYFYMLVDNANIRTSEKHREFIIKEWEKFNSEKNGKDSENLVDNNKVLDNKDVENKVLDNKDVENKVLDNKDVDNKVLDNKNLDNEDVDNQVPDNKAVDNQVPDNKTADNKDAGEEDKNKVRARILCCVTGFLTNVNGLEEAFVFGWDGHKLEELAKMVDGYKIYTQAGTQIVGRGYSIYIVGGEKFLGHGTFNFYITRFCLITKKWYRVERLLEERRHMVATFVGNKLVLIGGVGKFRVKLTSVHILDIHTGVWTKGHDSPFTFTDIPPFCVIDSKVLIAVNGIYSYDVRKNEWSVVIPCSTKLMIRNILYHDDKLYAFIQTQFDEPVKVKICVIERISEVSNNFTFVTQGEIIVGPSYNLITIDNYFVWFINNDGTIAIRVGRLELECYLPVKNFLDDRPEKVAFKTNVGCFRILNPRALFMTREELKALKSMEEENTTFKVQLQSGKQN